MEESSALDSRALWSVRGRLPFAGVGSPITPNCSGVRSLPQTLIAESMSVESPDPKAMGEVDGEMQKDVALLVVLFLTTKLARLLATMQKSGITHVRLQLEEIMLCVEMLSEFLRYEKTLVAQHTLMSNGIGDEWFCQ